MSSIADLMHPLLRESAPGGVEAKACGIRLNFNSYMVYFGIDVSARVGCFTYFG